jgi:hypothetical protein
MIGMDKLYHFIGGFIVCCVVAFLCSYLEIGGLRPEGYGLLASFGIGALKETFDYYQKRPWDMFDFLATCGGGFAGVFIIKLF